MEVTGKTGNRVTTTLENLEYSGFLGGTLNLARSIIRGFKLKGF